MHSDRPAVRIRAATAADIPDLAGVQLRSALAGFAHIFPDSIPKPTQPELEDEWAVLVARSDRTILAATIEELIVATVVFGSDDDTDKETDCMLLKLYVDPDFFGQGVGTTLYDEAINALRGQGYSRARLWVLEENTSARTMYERRGWEQRPWVRSDWPGSGVNEVGYVMDL